MKAFVRLDAARRKRIIVKPVMLGSGRFPFSKKKINTQNLSFLEGDKASSVHICVTLLNNTVEVVGTVNGFYGVLKWCLCHI